MATKASKKVKNTKAETATNTESLLLTRTMDFLPAPEELARYEKVVPGGAERILEMAENQSRHRRELEECSMAAEIRATRIKQILTFVLALVAGVLGGVLLLTGSELAGLIVILVDAAALVGIALYANKLNGDE